MPTQKQIAALDNLVGNGGNVTQAMRDAGYSENTLNTPQKLTESKGFKELCEEYGLTDQLIISSLVEDIQNKPKNRKPELELAAKIKGLMVERREDSGTITMIVKDYTNGADDSAATEAAGGVTSLI